MNEPEQRELKRLTHGMVRLSEEAWKQFHSLYHGRMMRYATTLHGGRAVDAADTVQLALLRAVKHVKVFKSEEVLWSWLALLLRCVAADAGRRARTQGRLEEALLDELRVKRAGGDGAREVILEEVLHELEESEREMLEQKYMMGATTAELAKQRGLSPKAVENRLRRLRKQLKVRINELTRQTAE